MDLQLEIKLGIGLSSLSFGASMQESEEVFGKANKEELVNDIEEYPTIVRYYDDIGVSLFFDPNHSNSFICADIGNPEAKMWGKDIFELNEKEIIELFKKNGIYIYETERHEWGESRLSFDEANVDFYFANSQLISVNYGVITEGSQTLILPN